MSLVHAVGSGAALPSLLCILAVLSSSCAPRSDRSADAERTTQYEAITDDQANLILNSSGDVSNDSSGVAASMDVSPMDNDVEAPPPKKEPNPRPKPPPKDR